MDYSRRNRNSTLIHMPFNRHKIFASGVHQKPDQAQAVWPADRVRVLFETSKQLSPRLIPYTFRHPANNLPVLGYAERDSLEMVDDGGRTYLSVLPKEMAKEFLGGLKEVGFDKVSIGIGKQGEIVHIGFTDNPAVAGLGAAFEATETVPPVYLEEVEFEGSDLGDEMRGAFEISWKWRLQSWMSDVADLFQKMREQKIEADGIEAADKFLPGYVLDFLKRPLPDDPAETDLIDGQTPIYEGETPMTDAERKEMERLQNENKSLMDAAAAEAKAKRLASVETFCADHPTVVTPKVKPQVVAILTALQGVEAPVTFEVDGSPVEKSAFEAFCELIAGAKPAVVFEEKATTDKAPAGSAAGAADDPVHDELHAQFEAARGK